MRKLEKDRAFLSIKLVSTAKLVIYLIKWETLCLLIYHAKCRLISINKSEEIMINAKRSEIAKLQLRIAVRGSTGTADQVPSQQSHTLVPRCFVDPFMHSCSALKRLSTFQM